jgi:excisionase family DNA binding protein
MDLPDPSSRDALDALPTGSGEVITADEVAALLRMTPAWVYSETRRNRIPHMRLGRYFRYRRSAIQAWMSDLEEAVDAPAATRTPRGNADNDRGDRVTRSGESVGWARRSNSGRTSS